MKGILITDSANNSKAFSFTIQNAGTKRESKITR